MFMDRYCQPMLKFVFNIRKASQAAAYLTNLHGGRLNLMVLLKLLYLADRASLLETGYTITGDQMISVQSGPALSRLYDVAKWGAPANPQEASAVWYGYVTEINDVVSLVEETPQRMNFPRTSARFWRRSTACMETGILSNFEI